MNVIIMGEESQEVCIAFRNKGHVAFSSDLQDCSGGHPEWHIKGDMFDAFYSAFYPNIPDLAIVHPTCTYMCNSGVLRLYLGGKKQNGIDPVRWTKMVESAEQFKRILDLPVKSLAVENPVMHGHAKAIIGVEQTQSIQPYEHGHPESKRTCLWLKGLPLLRPSNYASWNSYVCRCGGVFDADLGKYGCCDGPAKPLWDNQCKTGSGQNNLGKGKGKERSKTYRGIAQAMADQWTEEEILNYNLMY